MVKKILLFYIFFEIRLLPISILIMSFGYQPERTSAFFYILLYTIGASLPLMVIIIYFREEFSFTLFFQLFYFSAKRAAFLNCALTTIKICILLGFLVKFPMYGVHLWLPKAHVEAPVRGSMILAGLLLKLGGFGICQFRRCVTRATAFRVSISAYRLGGGALIAALCVRQVDIKVLIAYSSVRHLSLAISAFFIKRHIVVLGGVLILLAHGVSSPGIFFGAHLMYLRRHSRNLLLNHRFLNLIPIFSFWWFLLCLSNIGAPPTLNM
jgi:NADH-ubiquinone oxidoreductase chain 4